MSRYKMARNSPSDMQSMRELPEVLPMNALADDVWPIDSLAPYERRVIELLRNSKDKRARKLAKKRVRGHISSPMEFWPQSN